jgi:hypothetical protein
MNAASMPSDGTRLTRSLSAGVVAVSVLVLASWALIAGVHVDDAYHVSWVSGSWIALARYANHGVLYPPFHDGDSFGGTRYMPLQFVLHAGLARVTGEYLVSAKLFAYASAGALYVLAFFVYKRTSGSWPLALGLVAAVLSSGTGLEAATTVRGDALPAALQLGAVTVVTRRSRPATVLAGALCAFAFFSKLSAVWGAIAIVIWLAVRERSRLPSFLASLAACGGVLFGLFEAVSRGRMTSNILELAGAGQPHPFSVLAFADKIVRAAQESGTMWVLLPFALAGIGGAILGRRLTIHHVAGLVALVVVLVVLTDLGAYRNHFLDVQILVGVLVAGVWRESPPTETTFMRGAILAAVLLGTLASYDTEVVHDTKTAVHALRGRDHGYEAAPLATVVSAGDRVLSEDPYVPVSRGEDPIVLDPFMLRKLVADHPDWQRQLIGEIEAHRFSKVVLVYQLVPADTWWWQTFDFGTPVATALTRNYRLLDVPGYYRTPNHLWVYVPRGTSS